MSEDMPDGMPDRYGWEIVWGFFFAFGDFFLDSGLDTFCMLFPAFRSWKLLRPNVFTAFWSSMLSFSVLFATFWTFCMLLPAFWSWK